MSIFLTGATGFVGRNFLHWLLKNEPETRICCLVRDREKAESQWGGTPKNVHWVVGDLLEASTYQKALQEAERVVHAAALVSLKNGPEFYRMNTDTTRILLSVLKNSVRLQRLVFVSSISAVDRPMTQTAIGPLDEETPPQPNTDYGKSKRLAEECVVESGVPYTILRPSYIYGAYPRPNSSMDRLIRHIAAGEHYTRFTFPGRASEIYAEDLAEIIWLATYHPQTENNIFFVSNPEPVTIASAFTDLASVLGVSRQPIPLSSEGLKRFQQLLYRKHPDHLILRILFEDFFYCSSEKWYRLTGYKPRFGYQEGMRRTVHRYRELGLLSNIG